MSRKLAGLAMLLVAIGAAGPARASLVLGSTVNGTLTDSLNRQYFTVTTATVGGAGFSGQIQLSFIPVGAAFGTDTLTVTIANTDPAATVGISFGPLVFDFSGLQVANGGAITGLTARAGGTLPLQSTSFTGTTITVSVLATPQNSLVLGPNTTLSTTFDIATSSGVAVPEPATLVPALSGVALLGLGYAWRKRRSTA
jgi:hypothetical protein